MEVTVLEARSRIGGRVFSHRCAESKSRLRAGRRVGGENHDNCTAPVSQVRAELQDHRFNEALLRDGK
jgi:monoamine oxidase